jgi:hypothetical protein
VYVCDVSSTTKSRDCDDLKATGHTFGGLRIRSPLPLRRNNAFHGQPNNLSPAVDISCYSLIAISTL